MHIRLASACGDGLIDDDAIVPHVAIAYIACGAQAAAPEAMAHCLALCARHGVAAAASPGSVEQSGLGRRIAIMMPEDLASSVRRQIAALTAMAQNQAVPYVRLHGSLNGFAGADPDVAEAVCAMLAEHMPAVTLIAPYGSALLDAARRHRLMVLREIAADRRYEPDGSLRGRSLPDAYFPDAEACTAHLQSVSTRGYSIASDGSKVFLEADIALIDASRPGAALLARKLARL
jgi:UPF0271 protein